MDKENEDIIIEKVRKWIENPAFTASDIQDPNMPPDTTVIHVKGLSEKDYFGNQKEVQYFLAFLSDSELLSISTYFYFDKSAATGFTVLPTDKKVIFANAMKIPLLTLGLGYMWIPDLRNIESLQMNKVLYYDGFSRNAFEDARARVMNGWEIVSARYDEFVSAIHSQRR
jgi:hypothetical protein